MRRIGSAVALFLPAGPPVGDVQIDHDVGSLGLRIGPRGMIEGNFQSDDALRIDQGQHAAAAADGQPQLPAPLGHRLQHQSPEGDLQAGKGGGLPGNSWTCVPPTIFTVMPASNVISSR